MSPFVSWRWFLHSSQSFAQYLVSSNVFLGIPCLLSRAISSSVFGDANLWVELVGGGRAVKDGYMHGDKTELMWAE